MNDVILRRCDDFAEMLALSGKSSEFTFDVRKWLGPLDPMPVLNVKGA
jgi:hypothetical protein